MPVSSDDEAVDSADSTEQPTAGGDTQLEIEDPGPDDIQDTSYKDTKYSWVVCFAAFMLQVIVVGFLHVFGIFFSYFIEEFKTSKAETAWLGSIAYGLNMAFGCITGLVEARIGTRPVLMIGSTICTISLVASSFAPNIEVLFFTFSVVYGIGSSMAYTPTMCLGQIYFDKYISLATGIMVAGSSTGTLVLSPITQVLLEKLGWRNSFRIFSGFLFSTVVFGALVRPVPITKESRRQHHSQAKQLLAELKIWKDRVFILWTIALALSFFAYYIIGVHLVTHVESLGIPAEKAANLMIVLGASTAVGRVMWGKIVQWRVLNRVSLHQTSMIVMGTGYMLLPLIKSYGGLIAYITIHGLVDGCYVVLLPIVTSRLVGSEKASVAWGFLVGVCSLTFMTGPPMAGFISDTTGSYNLAFHIAAIPLMTAALLLFLIPWAQRTARSTNSLHEIKNFANIPPSPDLDQMRDSINTNLLVDSYGYDVINNDEVQRSRKYVHFEDLSNYQRWRSTGVLDVKRNRSAENQEKTFGRTTPGRRRCISESTDSPRDLEPLEFPSLKPITEQIINRTADNPVASHAGSRNIGFPLPSPDAQPIKINPPTSPQERADQQKFETSVQSALLDLSEENSQSTSRTVSDMVKKNTSSGESGLNMKAMEITSPLNSAFEFTASP